MTYDDTAKKLAAKVIGTVESSLQYDSINYSDPITVGIAQWFGTRAAAILSRMKATTHWTGVVASLNNQLGSIPPNDTFWNTRYLTTDEGTSLEPVLIACAAIQIDQLIKDLDVYKDVAVGEGVDPDADTDMMILFFTAYHQSPASALDVLAVTGPHASLADFYDAVLLDPVLGDYEPRYTEARDLIIAGDVTGIDDPDGTEGDPITGVGNGGANFTGNLVYIETVGGNLHIHYKDGQTIQAYPDGRGRYLPRAGELTSPTDPTDNPPTGGGAWVDPMPDGVMTSPYGPRDASIGGGVTGSFHYGIDLASPAGGPPATIYAPADMVITVAADNWNWTTGTCVKAHTTDNAYTFSFNHMQYASLVVSVGQTVTKGSKIGIEGATGNVSGRHCHIELYEGAIDDPWAPPYGNPIDPAPVFAANGVTF